jgi:hypothetical protein
MKPVSKSPEANRGWASSADWKAMLLATPRTVKPPSACCMVAIASARSAPTAISLQIIES